MPDFDLRRHRAVLGEKLRKEVGADRELLSRQQVEISYPLFRCRYWMAGNSSINARLGHFMTPLVELPAIRAALQVPLRFSYTHTDATFRNSFSSGFEEWGDVESGDELPYLPPNQLQAAAGLRSERWSTTLSATWLDRMRSVAGQGPIPESELIDQHWVLDWAGSFSITDNFGVSARVENLLDETYMAARRPAGARPGRPRAIFLGMTGQF